MAARSRSTAQPRRRRGRDRLGLHGVDPLKQPRQEAAGVAADLVAAQREVVEPVEHEGEPVGGRDGLEERVEPGLDRVRAQEALGDRLVRALPELLVGTGQIGLDARPQGGRPGAGPGDDEDPLGAELGAERDHPGGERRGLAAARTAAHEDGPFAVLRHPALGVGQGRLRQRFRHRTEP